MFIRVTIELLLLFRKLIIIKNQMKLNQKMKLKCILMQDIFLLLKAFGESFIIGCIITPKCTKTGSSPSKPTICYISRWGQFTTYCKSFHCTYDNFNSLVSRKSTE